MRFLVVLALAGCAHAPVGAVVHARIAQVATAVASADAQAIDAVVTPTPPPSQGRDARARSVASELAAEAVQLRAGLDRPFDLRARVHLAGPLATHISLEHDPNGWRVDPDSIGIEAPTPRAAVELLAVALDRLETDPALALLTHELRADVVRSTRSRAEGLRDLARRLPQIDATHSGWPLDLDYGQGLFVRLRAEHGQWRVDDFN